MEKLKQTMDDLGLALSEYRRRKVRAEKRLCFLALSKAFEACLEYCWKALLKKIRDEGLDAVTPKDVMKVAGKIGLLDDVERWIQFINFRNLSVHDYFEAGEGDYVDMVADFYDRAEKLIPPIG